MGLASLLLLADGRLPAGGHAHSGGAETACTRGLVHDASSLQVFLRGRLRTAGRVAAGGAAAACHGVVDPARLDAELDARTPSPATRAASRAQGRALLRLARTSWPSPDYDRLPAAPHHPAALGTVAAVAGCTPYEAAVAAALHAVSGPATAVVRLLGLDPYAVSALQAALAVQVERVARDAVADVAAGRLPATGSPLLDLLAEQHAATAVPLFAS